MAMAAALPLWATGLVLEYVGNRNGTALSRASAWTSIMPFVGCGVQYAADEERGKYAQVIFNAILCAGEMMLFLPPAWPVAVVVMAGAVLYGAFSTVGQLHQVSRAAPKQASVMGSRGGVDEAGARHSRSDEGERHLAGTPAHPVASPVDRQGIRGRKARRALARPTVDIAPTQQHRQRIMDQGLYYASADMQVPLRGSSTEPRPARPDAS